MKIKSTEGYALLTNADTGEQVGVPNGTKVTVMDDWGDGWRLMTEHVQTREDWACMYEGAMYFINRHVLVRNQDA